MKRKLVAEPTELWGFVTPPTDAEMDAAANGLSDPQLAEAFAVIRNASLTVARIMHRANLEDRLLTEAEISELEAASDEMARGKDLFMITGPWRQFYEGRPWALLNTSTEEIRETAAKDVEAELPWGAVEIEELTQLVGALRELYILTAQGRQVNEEERFQRARRTVFQILRRHWTSYSPDVRHVGDKTVVAMTATVDGSIRGLLGSLEVLIRDLLNGLDGANPSTVYVCEYCGRIGPAKQRNKRFCGATCKQAVYRKKVDT